jgi:hypothetical protein
MSKRYETFYLDLQQHTVWIIEKYYSKRKHLQLSFNVHGSVHRRNILIYKYIQQDATLRSLFYLETTLYVSCFTITHHQERKQLYLQHLIFVTQLLLPATLPADSSTGVTKTRCCRYSCLRS